MLSCHLPHNHHISHFTPSILCPYGQPHLHRLRPIPPDRLSKRPALALELLVRAELHALAVNHRQAVRRHTPRVAVEEHLHTFPHRLDGFLPRQFLHFALVRHDGAQDRLREVCAEARRQRRRAVGCAQ